MSNLFVNRLNSKISQKVTLRTVLIVLFVLRKTQCCLRQICRHDFLNLLEKPSIIEVKLGESQERNMTVLFSDIRSFAALSEQMTQPDNFEFINSYLGES